MALPNIFDADIVDVFITRIQCLTAQSQPLWGKMNVAQMLAHCNVTYELAYENIHPKPNFLVKLLLKTFVKNTVVGEKMYLQNIRTAPVFIIKTEKDFEKEKNRLFDYLNKTLNLGEAYFDGRKNISFGKLTIVEWNNMFYKHLNHHLEQFGV